MLKLLKCGGLIAKRHIEAVIDTRVYIWPRLAADFWSPQALLFACGNGHMWLIVLGRPARPEHHYSL